jgi:hypothetical protein
MKKYISFAAMAQRIEGYALHVNELFKLLKSIMFLTETLIPKAPESNETIIIVWNIQNH